MKEIPILFNTSMVQSLMAGIKSETRRLVKGIPLEWLEEFTPEYVANPDNLFCPYGIPGDLIWVRETYKEKYVKGYLEGFKNKYPNECPWIYAADGEGESGYGAWKPSIFMVKEACRLRLTVKETLIERVNEISEQDAINEGIFFDEGSGCWLVKESDIIAQSAVEGYKKLWQSINGVAKPVKEGKEITHYICYPWSEEDKYDSDTFRGKPLIQIVNPWVWVIKFNR